MTSQLAAPDAVAQVTWVSGECQLNPRAESYSVDSFVPGDPAAPGVRINAVSVTGIGPVVSRTAGDGGGHRVLDQPEHAGRGAIDPQTSFMDVTDVSNLTAGGGARALYTVATQFFTPGSQFGVAIDTSMPQDWGPANPPLVGPQRQLSGRVLIYGMDMQGRPSVVDNNYGSDSPSVTQWYPPVFCAFGPPYVAAMDYSAELVSLGLPTGTTCPGGPGGGAGSAPSTARADIFQVPTAAPSLPGQSLVRVFCPSYANPIWACTTSGAQTTFEIEACNVPLLGGAYTPFLLIQKNGVSPVVINGQSLIVNPNTPGVRALVGTINGTPPPQVFETSLFTNVNLAAPGTPIPPVMVPVPAAPVWHYYFCQWVLVCGQQVPFPSNLTTATFFTSEPFRIAVSNPH